MFHRLRTICMLVMFLAVGASPAMAQLSRFDKATLIDGLRREKMSELLLHLVRTDPPADPIEAKLIEIAQKLLQYGDSTRPLDERKANFQFALQGYRDLIKQFADNEQRPIWQTDLAELLLTEYLEGMNLYAGQFYEFGVPTADQKTAFESAAVEAFEQLADAMYRFFVLQTELPREPDHNEKRVNTGLWDRMINKYYKLRTTYFYAQAAIYVSLVPDDLPYYQTLGRNAYVRDQVATADQERQRLLHMTIDNLEPWVRDQTDPYGIRDRVLGMTARAMTYLGQGQDAVPLAQQVIGAKLQDMANLLARMAKIRALESQEMFQDALDESDRLADHAMVQRQIALRLLATDVKHRVMLAMAKKQPADQQAMATNQAYSVYEDLLTKGGLSQGDADSLRIYIYRRWKSSIQGQDMSLIPGLVVAAMGEIARGDGQNLIVRANQLEADGQADEAAKLKQEGYVELDRANQLLEGLLKREVILPSVKAKALYNLALSVYLRGLGDEQAELRAAGLLIDLADELPDQPDAERAIGLALNEVLRPLHERVPRPQGADEMYRRAVDVVMTKFPDSSAADDQRYYYAINILLPTGEPDKIREACDMLERVPHGHPDYYLARKELLYALARQYREAADDQKKAIGDRLETLARALIDDAERDAAAATGPAADLIRAAAGHAMINLADLYKARGDLALALEELQKIVDRFPTNPELMREGLSRRITVLADSGDLKGAVEEARRMMGDFPDDAAYVIGQVLDDVEPRMDELNRQARAEIVPLRRDALLKQRQGLAQVASDLADLLLNWAELQEWKPQNDEELAQLLTDLGEDPQMPREQALRLFRDVRLLPYYLIKIKSLRLAGDADEAERFLRPIAEKFPDDLGVLNEIGEVYFLKGKNNPDKTKQRQDFVKAATAFDRIIGSFTQDPYPSEFWNAWMRRFQIMEILDIAVSDIEIRIRNLRNIDPNLGGEQFRLEFDRLEQISRNAG